MPPKKASKIQQTASPSPSTLPLQSSLNSKNKVRTKASTKVYDTNQKSTWPVNDMFPMVRLSRIPVVQPSDVSSFMNYASQPGNKISFNAMFCVEI